MKLAWLCYENTYSWDDDEPVVPVIRFREPSEYMYSKVVPIVYQELEDNEKDT